MKKEKLTLEDEILMSQYAIEAIVKGYSNIELTDILNKDFSIATKEDIERVIKKAHITIRETTLVDIDKIIALHIELYEKIYKEFDELYHVPGKIKALRQKEKIAGMHKETNSIEIHNTVNVEIEKDSEYNIGKLNADEQKRLQQLMKKIENK